MSTAEAERVTSKIIGVDVGGTFTDVVAIEGARIAVSKVPTDVVASDRSVLTGAREVGVGEATTFNLASTAGLNAVITRRIPKIALLTTEGHRDTMDRGTTQRPIEALFDPSFRRSFGDAARPLVPRYLRRGVVERVTTDGSVLVELDEAQARTQLAVLRRCSVDGVAICLINSYTNPGHELRLRELVREELGDVACSVSSNVSPVSKEFWRTSTTVIDLIMKLKYGDYTTRLEAGLAESGFKGIFNYADCAAMLMPANYAMEKPFRLVVGGPAAGTLSSAHFGGLIDDGNLICADVGGTSCDISVVLDGRPWVNTSFELEPSLMVNAVSTDIVTLGAGGGSIVAIDATGSVRVGPDSAGADPGPACYGKGGSRPTLTDAYLLMGVLTPDGFLGGRMKLDPASARSAFERLDSVLTFEDRVRDAWRMALNNVAEGISVLAIRRGIDVRDFSLVAFGAAGPMLLPAVLDVLPLRRVIVPPHPGLFSALGLVSSDQVFSDERSAYIWLNESNAERLDAIFAEMERRLLDRVGLGVDDVVITRTLDGRLAGQSWDTPFVPVPNASITPEVVSDLVREFHDTYETRNGNRFEAYAVQAVTYRVHVRIPAEKVAYDKIAQGSGRVLTGTPLTLQYVSESPVAAQAFDRSSLLTGDVIVGPAVIREEMSTTFVPPNRIANVGSFGEIVIE